MLGRKQRMMIAEQMLPESIKVRFIYYDKVKDGINIFFG